MSIATSEGRWSELTCRGCHRSMQEVSAGEVPESLRETPQVKMSRPETLQFWVCAACARFRITSIVVAKDVDECREMVRKTFRDAGLECVEEGPSIIKVPRGSSKWPI